MPQLVHQGLLGEGEAAVREALAGHGYAGEDVEQVLEQVRRLPFFAFVTLAATDPYTRLEDLDFFLEKGAGDMSRSDFGVDLPYSTAQVMTVLRAVYRLETDGLENDLRDASTQGRITLALARFGARKLNVPAEAAEPADELLHRRTHLHGLPGVSAIGSRVFGRAPRTAREAFAKLLPDRALVEKVLADTLVYHIGTGEGAHGLVDSGTKVIAHLLDAERAAADEFPDFSSSFEALYASATPGVVREWAREVLDDPAVQLAVMIYARSRGIDIRKNDIRGVIDQLRDGDAGPCLVRAFARYEEVDGIRGRLPAALRERFHLAADR